MWNHTELPWRRSPVWLLIRVSLQLTMNRTAADSDEVHKRFMIFLLACALEVASKQAAPSSVLQPMSTKISRRLLKLEHPRDGQWLRKVQRIMSKTSNLLDQRWKEIRKQSKKSFDLAAVANLDLDVGIGHTLSDMERFLSSIQQRESIKQSTSFHPAPFFQPFNEESLPSVGAVPDAKICLFILPESSHGWQTILMTGSTSILTTHRRVATCPRCSEITTTQRRTGM